ncbi:MAG: hypothetical protein AB1938_25560, partial [Myxococcota bacterium]
MRNSVFAVMAGLGLGVLAVTYSACGKAPAKCSSSNCQGCCSADGICSGGGSVLECGTAGALCRTCNLNDVCIAGTCQPTGSGGGSGGGVGGGAGGGVGGGTGGGVGGGTGGG